MGRAPSPAAGPLAGLPAGGRGRPPRSRGTAPPSRCQSDYLSQADTPLGVLQAVILIGLEAAAAVAEDLVCLSLEGCSQEALASCLEMVADAAAVQPSVEEQVQLVMTGPKDPAYHRDTAVVVEDLFRRAQKSVLVAGYAVYQGKQVFQKRGCRMEEVPDLHVRVFLNVARKREDERASFCRIQRWRFPGPCACAPKAAPPGGGCLATPRIRELPSPLLRTRGVWLAGHLPAGEANAFREVLLFKLASDRIMPRVSHVGESIDHSQGKQNGGVCAEGDARFTLLSLV